jgi:IS30 family transposase
MPRNEIWEKGLIENTNKLIRQYIPKKQILEQLTTTKSDKYNIK